MPKIINNREELFAHTDSTPADQQRAVVMTMGALHAGHISLVQTARKLVGPQGEVMVTIFVNPMQFAANEDLDKYPRTFDDDIAMCAQAGVDVVFAPTPEVIYPTGGVSVAIEPGPLGAILEGAARPTHFTGVLTVVGKLLQLTKPDFAVYGEKDYQQLALIRLMARDLDFPVEIVGSATIREPDGLAMSSRNRYLDAQGRAAAGEISTAIEHAQAAAAQGANATDVVAAAQDHLDSVEGITVDYVVVVGNDLDDPPFQGSARILIAGWVSATRLLDNAEVILVGEELQ